MQMSEKEKEGEGKAQKVKQNMLSLFNERERPEVRCSVMCRGLLACCYVYDDRWWRRLEEDGSV